MKIGAVMFFTTDSMRPGPLAQALEGMPGVTFNFTQPMAMRLDEVVSGVKADVAVKLFGPDAAVLELARRIAGRAALTIYTNNGPIPKQHFAALFPEAAEIFTACHCSYEFATKKPDPASYVRLLAKLGMIAGETWFIDDKQSNVEGARLAGLAAHHFRSAPLLAEAARTLALIA